METPITDQIRHLIDAIEQDITLSELDKYKAVREGLDEICVKKEDYYPYCPMCGNGMPLGGYHFGTKKVCRVCYETYLEKYILNRT